MNAYKYDYLLEHIDELLDKDSDLYKDTKRISDAIPFSMYAIENKVYRFCNTYVVENAIMEHLRSKGIHVTFNGVVDHSYFHEGEGSGKPDLIDEKTGVTFEVKSPRSSVYAYDWYNTRTYNASYVFFYDREMHQLFNMDYDTLEPQLLCDLIIPLPFPLR